MWSIKIQKSSNNFVIHDIMTIINTFLSDSVCGYLPLELYNLVM